MDKNKSTIYLPLFEPAAALVRAQAASTNTSRQRVVRTAIQTNQIQARDIRHVELFRANDPLLIELPEGLQRYLSRLSMVHNIPGDKLISYILVDVLKKERLSANTNPIYAKAINDDSAYDLG